MFAFGSIARVVRSNKANKQLGNKPYNALTAALAKEAALEDIKKERKAKEEAEAKRLAALKKKQ